jgi:hypothetical protein
VVARKCRSDRDLACAISLNRLRLRRLVSAETPMPRSTTSLPGVMARGVRSRFFRDAGREEQCRAPL